MRARTLTAALGLAAIVAGPAAAGEEPPPVPDAQLLLDLDLLIQAEPQERDLMRRMSLVERLRVLELFRYLDARPAVAPAEPRTPLPPPPPAGAR
jgi:hypothetical protein